MFRLMILIIFGITLNSGYGTPFSVISFNTGLTSRIDHYEERRLAIGSAIQALQADVICLQEVWFSKDMDKILQRVNKTEFPYSYSYLHDDVSKLPEVSHTEATCATEDFVASFLPCIRRHCRNTNRQIEYLECAKRCRLLEMLTQPCITCLILSAPASAIEKCLLNLGNQLNVPGLLLLSKHPLFNTNLTFYLPKKKLLIPRAYISTEITGVGRVICTHSTANLGPVYFEELAYGSWDSQNVVEARILSNIMQVSPKGLILGDLNGGPEVCDSDVSADFWDAYNILLNSGLKPAFVESLGICTWCKYNPLTHAQFNKILDHAFVKNITVHGAMRILDRSIPGRSFPLSDHFGINVILDL